MVRCNRPLGVLDGLLGRKISGRAIANTPARLVKPFAAETGNIAAIGRNGTVIGSDETSCPARLRYDGASVLENALAVAVRVRFGGLPRNRPDAREVRAGQISQGRQA